jgi:DNA-binding HxlR family transcriptional regulator
MPSSDPINLLIQLSAQRWLAPLLADIAAHNGARFAELLHRLELPRDSLVRALTAAQQLGWVVRNTGHGHPLRPEYMLTTHGKAIALRAQNIVAARAQLGLPPGSMTRWGLPLVTGIAQGHDRFSTLARRLPPANPRALAQGLAALDHQRLIDKKPISDHGATHHYVLTDAGDVLAAACTR